MVMYSINNKAPLTVQFALALPQQIIDNYGTVRGALLYTYVDAEELTIACYYSQSLIPKPGMTMSHFWLIL